MYLLLSFLSFRARDGGEAVEGVTSPRCVVTAAEPRHAVGPTQLPPCDRPTFHRLRHTPRTGGEGWGEQTSFILRLIQLWDEITAYIKAIYFNFSQLLCLYTILLIHYVYLYNFYFIQNDNLFSL